MLLFAMAALLSVGLKEESALRSGCSKDDPVVATLARTDAVQVKFRLNGDGGSCYKVATPKGEGYLPAAALESSEEFERARLQGGELVVQPLKPEPVSEKTLAPEAALAEATRLLPSEPARALSVLEPALKSAPRDPHILALAGMASYRSDNVKKAVEYWKESLDLAPSPPVQRLYEKAMSELAADRSEEKKFGGRFVLRYDGRAVSGAAAERMVAALEESYGELSGALGCHWTERITTIVQTPADYRRSSDAPDWSDGKFDGRIRIALLEGDSIGPRTRRAFVHELTHACLASIGPIPIWLHEGLAQKMSGDVVTAGALREVRSLLANRKLPRVDRLTRDWFLMDANRAEQGYLLALAATEVLLQGYTQAGVRTLLRNPDALAAAADYVNGQLSR